MTAGKQMNWSIMTLQSLKRDLLESTAVRKYHLSVRWVIVVKDIIDKSKAHSPNLTNLVQSLNCIFHPPRIGRTKGEFMNWTRPSRQDLLHLQQKCQLIHLTILGDANRAVTMVISIECPKLLSSHPELDCRPSENAIFYKIVPRQLDWNSITQHDLKNALTVNINKHQAVSVGSKRIWSCLKANVFFKRTSKCK